MKRAAIYLRVSTLDSAARISQSESLARGGSQIAKS